MDLIIFDRIDSLMIQANEINRVLQRLQLETPNCGGAYYFWKIDLETSGDLLESVSKYLFRFVEGDHSVDLVLEKVLDFRTYLEQKLHDWSNHRTSLDCREEVTENYAPLEKEFREKMHAFLEQENLLGVYVVSGKDTEVSFGDDHVNDDTLIQTANACYVLHFGWSS